ncbi:hypothetical protein BC351_10680 [Paenibacillus ferrarius]|uniref:Uncharacterized protein n=1 Tax=Paenibacillus ferrarius TaxID=1469647 RepID=A0A1V4H961_9BACL|nr:hypothetical protein BC351_10680 [Paenibacillus ferrarius]
MSLKLRYCDVHAAMCYYCGVVDDEEKVCLNGFVPFHPSCLRESKSYLVKMEFIWDMLNIYYLYESEYAIRDLLKHEFNDERILNYKLIVKDRRFTIYVLSENDRLYMYSAQVDGFNWDEQRAELSKQDLFVFSNLFN